MLTKEQCNEALEHIKTLRGSNYGGYYSGFNNSALPFDEDINVMKELMHEYFDNPPLKFEELKEGMLVYDKNIKSWIEIDKTFEDIEKYVSCWSIGWPYEKRFPYEPNRFYRKEVHDV